MTSLRQYLIQNGLTPEDADHVCKYYEYDLPLRDRAESLVWDWINIYDFNSTKEKEINETNYS